MNRRAFFGLFLGLGIASKVPKSPSYGEWASAKDLGNVIRQRQLEGKLKLLNEDMAKIWNKMDEAYESPELS